MTIILRILAWLWPAREYHMPYYYWPKGDLATGHPWPPGRKQEIAE